VLKMSFVIFFSHTLFLNIAAYVKHCFDVLISLHKKFSSGTPSTHYSESYMSICQPLMNDELMMFIYVILSLKNSK